MNKFLSFLIFEAESGERERWTPIDMEHREYWNERYWHGYAAGMRHARQRFEDQFEILLDDESQKRENRMVENWFEFTMGEPYDKPVYTALWQLKDDVDLDKVYLKLAIMMMEFIKFDDSLKHSMIYKEDEKDV